MKRLLGRLLAIGLAVGALVLPGQVLTAMPQVAAAVDDSFTTDYPFPALGKGGKSTQRFNSEQLAGIKFDIKKATKIKIDILITDYVSGETVDYDQDEFFIKNSDYFSDLWNMSFGIPWGGSRGEFNETLFLNKGTYYFGLRGASSGIVNFTISDWEQYDETYPEEYEGDNNEFSTADSIVADQKVLGFAPGISENSSYIGSLDDADFYYIDVEEDGYYLVESDKPINILKQDESNVGTFGSYDSESESVFLPKGKYYVQFLSGGLDSFGPYSFTLKKQYRILFTNGDTKQELYAVKGDRIKKPNDPVKKGYTFKEWQINGKPYDFKNPVTGNVTLVASWYKDPTVSFDAQNGTSITNINVKYGTSVDEPEGPVRAGYLFKGWFADKALTKAYDFKTAVKTDMTLRAKWEKLLTVTFNANGGSAVITQMVNKGTTAGMPADPTRAGYTFKGWFSDKALTKAYDFSAAVKSDLTLYAKWEKAAPAPRPSAQFTDVTGTSTWVINQGYLDYAVEHGLMTGYKTNGKPNGKFGPEDTLTRGQVAVVLYRVATGRDSGDGSTGFKDQGAFPYYRTAIKWLRDNGISTGDKDPVTGALLNTFRPDDPITRQELATLVYRFARQQGVKPGKVDTGSLSKFGDNLQVMPFAREAMAWCNATGIITGGQGVDAGKVMPLKNATRAQAAKIFTVLHRDVLKK